MFTYFKINPLDRSIIEVLKFSQQIPEGDYNSEATSAVNGKPYLVESTVVEPVIDSDTQLILGYDDVFTAGSVATRTRTSRYRTPDEMKAIKLEQHNMRFEEELVIINSKYPPSEQKTWTKQELEAKAWTDNPSTPTPIIDSILITRGRNKGEHIASILAKTAALEVSVGNVLGKKQKLSDDIDTIYEDVGLTDEQKTIQINNVNWPEV